jgi:hypothetical protein
VSRRALSAIALCTVALAGCGGSSSDTATFDEDGYSIVFEHPSSFEEIDDVSIASTAGAASKDTKARGLDERNLLIVSRYDLNVSVTEENVADVKAELDDVISRAADQELSGTEIEVGGLPGYEYAFDLDSRPPVTSRFIVVFDDREEYTLNCQSTEERREEVEAACQQAVDTLTKK